MKLLHLANYSDQTLHIGLIRMDNRLELHIYSEPDPTRIEIAPMQSVPIDATPDIKACIVDEKLQYSIIGHCNKLESRLPTTAKPNGPVFRFFNREP